MVFFFFPSFYQAICTQASCLKKLVPLYLSPCFLSSEGSGVSSSQLQEKDMWDKRPVLVCS